MGAGGESEEEAEKGEDEGDDFQAISQQRGDGMKKKEEVNGEKAEEGGE
jgi:hypothetical protein